MSVSTLLSSLLTTQGAYFILVLLVGPWVDYFTINRHHTSSTARLRIYRSGVAFLVVYSLVGYALHGSHTAVHAGAALQKQAGWHELFDGWLHTAVVALTVVSSLPSFYVWYRCCVDQPYRATYLKELRPLRYLLPVTALERLWFGALSVAAGVCEEWIYRLLLLHWLSAHLSPMASVVVGAALFGFAHLYQGMLGIVRAGAAGLMFGLLYVTLGSWWVVAVAHAMADLQVLLLYRPDVDAPDEAKRLVKGCKLEVE